MITTCTLNDLQLKIYVILFGKLNLFLSEKVGSKKNLGAGVESVWGLTAALLGQTTPLYTHTQVGK